MLGAVAAFDMIWRCGSSLCRPMGHAAPKLLQARFCLSHRHTSPRARSSGASCCTCWRWHCSFRSTGSTTSSRARSAHRMQLLLLSVVRTPHAAIAVVGGPHTACSYCCCRCLSPTAGGRRHQRICAAHASPLLLYSRSVDRFCPVGPSHDVAVLRTGGAPAADSLPGYGIAA